MRIAATFGLICVVTLVHTACSENIDYTITIKTGNRANAGTDALVFMTIFGSSGSTGRLVLPNQSAGNFEKGDTDTFTLHTTNVGRISSIEIGHNNHGSNGGWFLDYVEIIQKLAAVSDNDIRPGTTKYRFDFFNWIASDEGDRLLIKKISTNYPEVNLG